ncbi:unnamed protein product, partial [Lymnaea stagnalis]
DTLQDRHKYEEEPMEGKKMEEEREAVKEQLASAQIVESVEFKSQLFTADVHEEIEEQTSYVEETFVIENLETRQAAVVREEVESYEIPKQDEEILSDARESVEAVEEVHSDRATEIGEGVEVVEVITKVDEYIEEDEEKVETLSPVSIQDVTVVEEAFVSQTVEEQDLQVVETQFTSQVDTVHVATEEADQKPTKPTDLDYLEKPLDREEDDVDKTPVVTESREDESPLTGLKYVALTDPATKELVRERIETIEEVVAKMERSYELKTSESLVCSHSELKGEEVKETSQELIRDEMRSELTEDASETTQDFSDIKSEMIESLDSQHDFEIYKEADTEAVQANIQYDHQPREDNQVEESEDITPAYEEKEVELESDEDKSDIGDFMDSVETQDIEETENIEKEVETEQQDDEFFASESVFTDTIEKDTKDDVSGTIVHHELKEERSEISTQFEVSENILADTARIISKEIEGEEESSEADISEDKENIEPVAAVDMDERKEDEFVQEEEISRGKTEERGLEDELESVAATAGSDVGGMDEVEQESTSDTKENEVSETQEHYENELLRESHEEVSYHLTEEYKTSQHTFSEVSQLRTETEGLIGQTAGQGSEEFDMQRSYIEEYLESPVPCDEEIVVKDKTQAVAAAVISVPDEEEDEIKETVVATKARAVHADITTQRDDEADEIQEERDIMGEVREEIVLSSTESVSHTLTQFVCDEHESFISEVSTKETVSHYKPDQLDGLTVSLDTETGISTLPDEEEDAEIKDVTKEEFLQSYSDDRQYDETDLTTHIEQQDGAASEVPMDYTGDTADFEAPDVTEEELAEFEETEKAIEKEMEESQEDKVYTYPEITYTVAEDIRYDQNDEEPGASDHSAEMPQEAEKCVLDETEPTLTQDSSYRTEEHVIKSEEYEYEEKSATKKEETDSEYKHVETQETSEQTGETKVKYMEDKYMEDKYEEYRLDQQEDVTYKSGGLDQRNEEYKANEWELLDRDELTLDQITQTAMLSLSHSEQQKYRDPYDTTAQYVQDETAQEQKDKGDLKCVQEQEEETEELVQEQEGEREKQWEQEDEHEEIDEQEEESDEQEEKYEFVDKERLRQEQEEEDGLVLEQDEEQDKEGEKYIQEQGQREAEFYEREVGQGEVKEQGEEFIRKQDNRDKLKEQRDGGKDQKECYHEHERSEELVQEHEDVEKYVQEQEGLEKYVQEQEDVEKYVQEQEDVEKYRNMFRNKKM